MRVKVTLACTECKQRYYNSMKDQKNAGIGEYCKGVKREMKKGIWPTKKETTSYTAVVIVTCALFALGFWLIDTGVLAARRAGLGVTL